MTETGALIVADSGEHTPEPVAGTVYSWHSMPSCGRAPADFPLTAFCACGQPIVRRHWASGWHHRAPGEDITEPADRDF